MRTKWHKYPREIPHETGFYLVKGTDEEGKELEDDAYWDGNTFKTWDLEDEVYKSSNEVIKKWAEKSSRKQIAIGKTKGTQKYCNGKCEKCKDYARCAEYVTGDWCDFNEFSPYIDKEDEDDIDWEDYD